jgi:hypothetical protein
MDITTNQRYANLALINLGEAVSEIGNVRNRVAAPEPRDFANARLALVRAIAALDFTCYVPPPDVRKG